MTELEVRTDPLTGSKSVIADARHNRPGGGFSIEPEAQINPEKDPFLEGHEDCTPPELYALRPASSEPNTPGWKVRVVPNLYPAFTEDAVCQETVEQSELFLAKPARGQHEVIINAPQAVTSLAALDSDQLHAAVEVWQHRIAFHSQFEFIQLIVNEGLLGGASLPHTHAQLFALPFVPATVARERERYKAYAVDHAGANLIDDLLSTEIRLNKRVVAVDDQAVLLTAYAPIAPYHLRILPRKPSMNFGSSETNGANLIQLALQSFQALFGQSPPLNIWVRTAPQSAEFFSWRIDIMPRLTHFAGFDLGTGITICTVSPESAAKQLTGSIESNPNVGWQ